MTPNVVISFIITNRFFQTGNGGNMMMQMISTSIGTSSTSSNLLASSSHKDSSIWILDMCCATGGKTLHYFLSFMMFVANDVVIIHELLRSTNVEKSSDSQTIV
jgi:hypothetical protein